MTGFSMARILAEDTSDIYMATDSPKGKAKRMANTVTHTVPSIRGMNPNWAAGVAVGNHSLPPNTSPADIVWSLSRLPLNPSPPANSSGTKATMPGFFSTSELMQAVAFS